MRAKYLEAHVQTRNESWRILGSLQDEDVVEDEGQMEDDEVADDGCEVLRRCGKTWLGLPTTATFLL